MALPGTESVRFRRPTAGPNAVAPKQPTEPKKDEFGSLAPQGWKRRHQGLLQDKLRRNERSPLLPGLSFAFRLLLLMRTAGAMYSIISDCDEVFNFFEPLHYFQHNAGFQTWELSPEFAVRSWAYVLLHWPLTHLPPRLLRLGKRPAFFALRICLGAISSFCEARFYRTVVETVNERVGRYLLFSMLLSAGMWSASVAFLPSSFTMYTTLLAMSYAFHPATSTPTGIKRAYRGTLFFALGAIVGWPFSAALGIPFVLEQLFLTGGEIAVGEERRQLGAKRWATLGKAVTLGACIAIPVFLIDSWAYGRPTFPTLNIIRYNLLSPHGPDLYGTSPPSYYLQNLFLNFNLLVPFALLSLPALLITYFVDPRRLGKTQMAPKAGETSPYTLLAMRLLPLYIWLAVFSAQAHKEERFMFPVYPLVCFNASVAVYLFKGWVETAYISITKSPYRASKSSLPSWLSLLAILVPGLFSLTRILALHQFYHAPLDILHHFQYHTLPAHLSALGYSAMPQPADYKPYGNEVFKPEWDFTVLEQLTAEQGGKVRLCYGGEWHRYPGSYLVPNGVEVRWIETEFDGMMPRLWEPSVGGNGTVWSREKTREVRAGRFNGANKASSEPGTYVDPASCTYLVALSLPTQKPTEKEPDWTARPGWNVEVCKPFLDGQASRWWSRLGWLGPLGESGRVWGRYCLLKRQK